MNEQPVDMSNGVSEAPEQKILPAFGKLKDSRFGNHFTYHAPTEGQKPYYIQVNEAAEQFAEALCASLPESADLSHALRLVVQTKMTANSYIATNPEIYR